MTIIKKVLVSFFFLLYMSYCHDVVAYVKEMICLKSKEKNHTLFLSSVNHTLSREDSLAQSKQMIHFLRSRDASLIAEDPSTVTGLIFSVSEICKKRRLIDTPVDYLTSLSHHSGITVTNVEFRTGTTRHRSKVSVEQLVKETEDVLQEINAYDDGPIANRYYKEKVSRHVDTIAPNYTQLFERIRKKNYGLSLDVELPQDVYTVVALYRSVEAFKKMECKQQIKEVLIDYNAELLDARLVHAVLMHQKQGIKKTVICAGNWHLYNSWLTLSKLGYDLDERGPLKIDNPLHLTKVLQELDPDYDPDAKLPKTKVDLLLDYTQFELEHPNMLLAIPATIVAAVLGVIAYVVTSIVSGGDGTQN